MGKAPNKIIAIVGETATGKSSLSMLIAQRYNCEIICADSTTIYKHMDIGTAKPSPADQSLVRHHLLDISEPNEQVTVAAFQKLAKETIKDIIARGKVPLIVGGSGFYIDSILFDYSFGSQPDSDLREKLQSLDRQELLSLAAAQGIDTSDIDINNPRRLIRAIESGGKTSQGQRQIRANTLVLGLKAPSRAVLRANIEARLEKMFKMGLKREVSELQSKYGWDIEAMKSIGYREFGNYYAGRQSMAATKRQIVKSNLELAKKQRTWFKKNPAILWFDNLEEPLQAVDRFLTNKDRQHPIY